LFSTTSKIENTIKPPVAAQKPHLWDIWGEKHDDPYYWLRDKTNQEVLDYLEAENKYRLDVIAEQKPLAEKIYKELLSRVKETDIEPPYKNGEYYYIVKTIEGLQYKIRTRTKGLNGPEESVLDQNELAKNQTTCVLGLLKLSPNQQYLAYSVDYIGREKFQVRVRDLATGKEFEDRIENTESSLEWNNDNKTLYYTTMDHAERPFKLWKHVLGTDSANDELLYHEMDEKFRVQLSKSQDNKYIFIASMSRTATEVRVLDADVPQNDDFKLFRARQQDVEYTIEHQNGQFIILTNEDAHNNRVMITDAASFEDRTKWRELVPHNANVKIELMNVFKKHLVLFTREGGLQYLQVMDTTTGEIHTVKHSETVYCLEPDTNLEYDTELFRFKYSSMVTPRSIIDYNMSTRTTHVVKTQPVLGYDASKYETVRVFAPSHDGVKVPISLVYRKDLFKHDMSNPLMLYGYGAYEVSIDPDFNENLVSLLDRGFVFAYAHIRGGGELGRSWYEDGKLLKKMNTFYDFIACAEYLLKNKYTSPNKLVIQGGSAGGLLICAVLNLRPELFKAALVRVPFVDVINTMLDPSLPLTVNEYEEWGNPELQEFYFYMKSYSPYDNIRRTEYPAIHINTGINDPRVAYWEPAKYVAKLRTMKTDNNQLLLKTEMVQGHFGASGRYDLLKERAEYYAWILYQVGIKE
jgi:oligopeptidase B